MASNNGIRSSRMGAESPVVIVLNKIKEHPFELNRGALKQKYAAIRDLIKTDCEDGTGIDQLLKGGRSQALDPCARGCG